MNGEGLHASDFLRLLIGIGVGVGLVACTPEAQSSKTPDNTPPNPGPTEPTINPVPSSEAVPSAESGSAVRTTRVALFESADGLCVPMTFDTNKANLVVPESVKVSLVDKCTVTGVGDGKGFQLQGDGIGSQGGMSLPVEGTNMDAAFTLRADSLGKLLAHAKDNTDLAQELRTRIPGLASTTTWDQVTAYFAAHPDEEESLNLDFQYQLGADNVTIEALMVGVKGTDKVYPVDTLQPVNLDTYFANVDGTYNVAYGAGNNVGEIVVLTTPPQVNGQDVQPFQGADGNWYAGGDSANPAEKFDVTTGEWVQFVAPADTVQPAATDIPTAIATDTETSTAVPLATDTEKSPALPDFLTALQADATKEVDLTAGVAWDTKTGLVYAAKDAKGEWVSYPDGNVPIPPGPGQEGSALEVPLYHTATDAMYAITGELPWNDVSAYKYRPDAINKAQKVNTVYWNQFLKNNPSWKQTVNKQVNVQDLNKPDMVAAMSMFDEQIPGGEVVTQIYWASKTTGYDYKEVLIYGDPQTIETELAKGVPGPTAVRP